MEKKLTPLMMAIERAKHDRARYTSLGEKEYLDEFIPFLESLLQEEENMIIEFRKSALISAGMNENLAQSEASEMFRQTFKTNNDE